MFSLSTRGSLTNLERILKKASRAKPPSLDKYGRQGVEALSEATPLKSGKTANSWSYQIVKTASGSEIQFLNSNVNKGVNIAVILQYGHGTGTGGYVEGIDYINPAIRPIFEGIAKNALKEVIS